MLGIPILPAVMNVGRSLLKQQGVTIRGTQVSGRQVSYLELRGSGRGLPMLLVHGLAGSSWSWGRLMIALSAHSSRLIALDFPGANLSPEPSTGPLRYPELVELVEHFAQKIMPERFVLSGASMGAAIAARAALRLGERARALAMVVPAGARVSEQQVPEQLARLRVTDRLEARALVSRLFARPSPLREWVLADDAFHLYNQRWVKAIVEEAARDAGTMVLQEEELSALKIPTAVYWAREEHLLMEDGLRYFRQHLPQHAEIEELDGVGHCAHLEKPKLVAAKIAAFLSKRGL